MAATGVSLTVAVLTLVYAAGRALGVIWPADPPDPLYMLMVGLVSGANMGASLMLLWRLR